MPGNASSTANESPTDEGIDELESVDFEAGSEDIDASADPVAKKKRKKKVCDRALAMHKRTLADAVKPRIGVVGLKAAGLTPLLRKQKKKKKPAAQTEVQDVPAQPSGASKQELDSRFATALEQLQRNLPDSAWTQLDSCNMHDAKTRKVAQALRNNTQLTSLDLSSNHIGDSGAEALADVLQKGAAPELVFLDLRSNPFGASATLLLSGLQNSRRKLSIQVGDFAQEADWVEEPSASNKLGKKQNNRHRRGRRNENWADPDGSEMLEVKSTLEGSKGPRNGFLDQFFQVGNGVHSHDLPEPADATVTDPEEASQQMWEEIEALFLSTEPDIHELSSLLRQCLAGISKEMAASSVPLLSNTRLPELQPFTRQAVLKLALLSRALDLEPPAFVTPYSKSQPVAGVGSHRASVAQIIERLSYGRLAAINTHLVKAAILPRLFALCFACPNNNVLQAACCNTVRWILESRLHLLWQPLLKPGMGLLNGVLQQSSRSSLTSEVMAVIRSAADAPTCARRTCSAGFALSVASQLKQKAETDELLHSSLQETSGWSAFAAENGLLQELVEEQSGDLCGPRPIRPTLQEQAQQEESQGLESDTPELIGSTDLVKLLSQSVHGLHINENESADYSDEDSDEEQPAIESWPDDLQRLIETPVVDVGDVD